MAATHKENVQVRTAHATQDHAIFNFLNHFPPYPKVSNSKNDNGIHVFVKTRKLDNQSSVFVTKVPKIVSAIVPIDHRVITPGLSKIGKNHLSS